MSLLDTPALDQAPFAPPTSAHQQATPTHWSNEMYLMNEALARAHSHELRPTDHQRRATRLVAARRLERRAARARQRARRLSLAAVTLHHRA